MNVVLWVLACLLAAFFLAAGAAKLAQSKEKLTASPNMAWATDFSPGVIKMIGAAVTHARRRETQAIAMNVVLLAVAAVVAWGRFGPYSFS
jgi:hypothetical protein